MPVFVVFLLILGLLWPITLLIMRNQSGNRLSEGEVDRLFDDMAERMRDLEDEVGDLNENVERLQDELDFTRRLLEPPRGDGEGQDKSPAG